MKRVEVRFYAELNDFLPLWRRKRPTTCDFGVSGSVKDMIEALGVPHTEVDLILANNESVDFSYRVQDGAQSASTLCSNPSIFLLSCGSGLRRSAKCASSPMSTSAGWRRIYRRMRGFIETIVGLI